MDIDHEQGASEPESNLSVDLGTRTRLVPNGDCSQRRDTAWAMSQENVEIVRRIYQSFNAGDWDAAFRDVHEDVELETQLAGSFRGRGEARRFFEDQVAPFEFFNAEPEEILDVGDQIVALLTVQGRPRGSSAEIKVRVGHLWTLRDGTAVSLRSFPKRKDALEAAGLSE